ncbi:phosphonate ABC transporter ATP-binding protein [Paenibacillus sp. y28]|uniref:phosphonate ABC transporter ATP-binding protein n=1 Tax=Paenibacillus sp. y28 TaxID=3129110 RepID=UPI0030179997
MIIVRNLVKTFPPGQQVLSGVSFQADPGEFIAVVGASGSGKSTLLRCLFLKEAWTSGQYIYKGSDVTTSGLMQKFQLRRDWAYLEEKPDMDLKASAHRNVLGGRFYQTPLWRKLTRSVAVDEHVLAMDYLEKVGLLDKAEEKAEKLSGGEKQRVALARALVQGAEVIFADEPVTGLQPEAAERVLQDLRSICVQEKKTVICTLHNLEWAERFATRIWGLSGGRIAVDVAARRLTMREREMIF